MVLQDLHLICAALMSSQKWNSCCELQYLIDKEVCFSRCLVFFSTTTSHRLFIQTYLLFKSHLVVQIWTIIYVEYFVNIYQKFGQKIQVKTKFPQAVITNIRTLPPVFLKIFWTAAWRKTPEDCFWHYVCKTIYSSSRRIKGRETMVLKVFLLNQYLKTILLKQSKSILKQGINIKWNQFK